ncbi:MAG: tryptophan synthase alpha chain, partial [Candidatus Marinamargulisbacteria bacterium]
MASKHLISEGNAVIPYFTFGDPTMAFTEQLILASFEAGADLIEIGLPFSDPIADGPVIQTSHFRALKKNPTLNIPKAFDMVDRIKRKVDKPLVFMAASNLIYRFGLEEFFSEAEQVSLDGVIIPDLPVEEADDFRHFAKIYGIHLIFLVSPLCSRKRLERIVR